MTTALFAVFLLAPPTSIPWLVVAALSVCAWLSLRVPRRARRGVVAAVGLALVLFVVAEGIPVDVCAACRAGVMPEWWCWLNWCW